MILNESRLLRFLYDFWEDVVRIVSKTDTRVSIFPEDQVRQWVLRVVQKRCDMSFRVNYGQTFYIHPLAEMI
jgi:hypothetical protein